LYIYSQLQLHALLKSLEDLAGYMSFGLAKWGLLIFELAVGHFTHFLQQNVVKSCVPLLQILACGDDV
jgi:hypothetical protein